MVRMTELLRDSKVVFAWTLADMLGLNPSMVVHRLNLDPNAKKIIQKKCMFTPER